jgi:hypothetical protein
MTTGRAQETPSAQSDAAKSNALRERRMETRAHADRTQARRLNSLKLLVRSQETQPRTLNCERLA